LRAQRAYCAAWRRLTFQRASERRLTFQRASERRLTFQRASERAAKLAWRRLTFQRASEHAAKLVAFSARGRYNERYTCSGVWIR